MCFKEKNKEKYIRVLSSKSSNEYRFECMCFELPIKMRENHRLTKIFNPENAFSTIDFESIYIEDYPLLCSSFSMVFTTPSKSLTFIFLFIFLIITY